LPEYKKTFETCWEKIVEKGSGMTPGAIL